MGDEIETFLCVGFGRIVHRKQSDKIKWMEKGRMLPQIEREGLMEKEDGKGGCEYVNMDAPDAGFAELEREIWEYIDQRSDVQNSTWGLLSVTHINRRHKLGRRKPCDDTSPEKVAKYLECSFNNVTSQHVTLLMATSMKNYGLEDFNERVKYHLDIQNVAPSNVKVLDLNDILEHCLMSRSSASIDYFKRQYPAVVLLKRLLGSLRRDNRIRIHLSRRGGDKCEDCTSVQHQLAV
ncbi:MAG: hypothetical protein SGARI_003291 [Bacillariaceae sp.]